MTQGHFFLSQEFFFCCLTHFLFSSTYTSEMRIKLSTYIFRLCIKKTKYIKKKKREENKRNSKEEEKIKPVF